MNTRDPETEMKVESVTPDEPEKKEIPVTRLHAHKEGYVSDEEFKRLEIEETLRKEVQAKEDQLKALRQAQWEKDPEMFFHMDDVIFAAIKGPNGQIGIASGAHPRPIVEAAITRMTYKAFMMFQHMDLQQSMRNKGIITPPDTGIVT